MLVKVTGKPHTRFDEKKGRLVSFQPGALIDATAKEVAAFAGRLVPVTAEKGVDGGSQ